MAREVLHRAAADAHRVPWKNGRGVTEELAIWPAGATLERGDFAWRISRARVEEDGPFSTFAGCERILLVTGGAGLVLHHGASAPRARLRPLEPYRFAGEWPTRAELVAGAVTDFNVIVRRDGPRADVEVARLGVRRTREVVGSGNAFLHALSGALTVRLPREEEPFELEAGESVWARELDREEEVEVAGRSATTVLILVRLSPIAG